MAAYGRPSDGKAPVAARKNDQSRPSPRVVTGPFLPLPEMPLAPEVGTQTLNHVCLTLGSNRIACEPALMLDARPFRFPTQGVALASKFGLARPDGLNNCYGWC